MYIVIEGIDTCGKSTQIELLKERFSDAIFTKEPGGSELGIKLREILLGSEIVSKKAELFLFLADRSEHYKRVIEPNREKMIISDRGFISGIAYADEFDIEYLISLNRFALESYLPQKIIFLEIEEDELKRRIGSKELDRIEKRGISYLLNLQKRIKEILEISKIDYIQIDASMDIPEIFSQICSFIEE